MQILSPSADARTPFGLADQPLLASHSFDDLFERLKRSVDQTAYKYHGLNQRLDVDDLKQVGYITSGKLTSHTSPSTVSPLNIMLAVPW